MAEATSVGNRIQVKVVVVGDRGVGKSCFIMGAVDQQTKQSEGLYPPMHDTRYIDCDYEGRSFTISFWDTAGGEAFECVRPLCYVQADLFILCYSSTSPSSFKSAKTTWKAELRHHCPQVPIILLCTKTDLRSPSKPAFDADHPQGCISYEEGMDLAHQLDAVQYFECSAREGTGDIKLIELELARLYIATLPRKASRRAELCALL